MADPLAEWEEHAAWWQADFTDGADIEYVSQIIPLIAKHLPLRGSVLDIGAGEGQVARVAAEAGLAVTALDVTRSQIDAGRARGGVHHWVQGAALALPFADASFDAAIACLVFEHIADLDGAIREVSRVLKPGGTFLMLLNHPLLQTPGSGWIDDQILMEEYWRIGDYLPESESIEEVSADVLLTFFHRPLGRYLNSLIEAGLSLTAFIEPPPVLGDSETIPRLLFLETRRLTHPPIA